jgi:DNA-binding transcriptional regulator YdaS (Cro superfamily)
VLDLQPILLKRAAEIAGGSVRLCECLRVSPERLDLWLSGGERLPDEVFLTIVDMVLRDDMARAQDDRRQQPRSDSQTPASR